MCCVLLIFLDLGFCSDDGDAESSTDGGAAAAEEDTEADGTDETARRDLVAERAELKESLQREGLRLLEASLPETLEVRWGKDCKIGNASPDEWFAPPVHQERGFSQSWSVLRQFLRLATWKVQLTALGALTAMFKVRGMKCRDCRKVVGVLSSASDNL